MKTFSQTETAAKSSRTKKNVASNSQAKATTSSHSDHASSFPAQCKTSINCHDAVVQRQENTTGLPDNLKSGIENLSGFSMDDVKVHYNSSRPAQLKAHAFAQGSDIHLASGQEKHLPHEAWHVVQQKQGRVKPTLQMKTGLNVNDDKGLEREADAMGERIARNPSLQTKQQPVLVHSDPDDIIQGVFYIDDKPGWKMVLHDLKTDPPLNKSKREKFPEVLKVMAALEESPVPINWYGEFGDDYDELVKDIYDGKKTVASVVADGKRSKIRKKKFRKDNKVRLAELNKSIEKSTIKLNASSVDDGMRRFKEFLSGALEYPGSSIKFKFEIDIAVLGIKGGITLDGSAGRGIDGFATSGYPEIADNPNHLEMGLNLSGNVGIGENCGAAKASLALIPKVFMRAGADNTKAAVNALTYALYRILVGSLLNNPLGPVFFTGKTLANWLFGGGLMSKGKTVKAETWAADIEKKAFKDANAFADVGGGLGIEAEMKVKNLSDFKVGGGMEAFKRYDSEGLERSMGTAFGKKPNKKGNAKKRRNKASGMWVGSSALALEFSVGAGPLSASLSAGVSTEFDISQEDDVSVKDRFKKVGSDFLYNMAVVISGEVGAKGALGKSLVANIPQLIASIVNYLVTKWKKGKKGAIKKSRIEESLVGFAEALSKSKNIGKLGNSSAIGNILTGLSDHTISLTLNIKMPEKEHGEVLWRVDLNRGRKLVVPDNTYVVAEGSKTDRIISFGYENKKHFHILGGNK